MEKISFKQTVSKLIFSGQNSERVFFSKNAHLCIFIFGLFIPFSILGHLSTRNIKNTPTKYIKKAKNAPKMTGEG